MWKITVLLLALALGGCAASRAITQDDDAVCKSMDAHPGTDVYVQCRLAQQARRDAAYHDVGDRLHRASAAAQSLDPPPSRPMHCTSSPWLNDSRIDCF
jgi:hypothetical protein